MRRRTLSIAAVVATGALLGWLAASGHLTTAVAQNKTDPPATGGTQLPKPDPSSRVRSPRPSRTPHLASRSR
jgi:hypothetical protein